MDGDLGHWPERYPNLYNRMGNDNHHMESGDIGYDIACDTHLSGSSAKVGFFQPAMDDDFLGAAPFSDISYDQNALYTPPGNITTNQRQQLKQLYIDTQLNPYQMSDSDSSTASSSSLSNIMTTSFHLYSGLQPSVHISSPQSAPAGRGAMMLDFEAKSPIPPSPFLHYPPMFEGDNVFDFLPPSSMESDVETQMPLPHILGWKRVIEQCGTDDFVPQGVYQPYTEADRKRYIRDVDLHDTIFFQSDGSSELGVSLDDALKQRLRLLKDKDDLMFVGCGPSVSIRLQWPGYPPWSKQIPTMDFKNPKGPITRAKLAKNIATCIKRFVEFAQDKPMEADSDRKWRVGKRNIKVEDIILVSLHHVSKGSWQPQLRLRAPSSTSIPYQWDESVFPTS